LRISNGSSDYSLIGCNDADGGTNTRIGIVGNTFGGENSGRINYMATSTGPHVFSTTDSGTERMRITSTGNVGIGTNNPSSKLHIALPDDDAITANVLDFRNIANYGIYATSKGISARGNTLDFLARDYNLGIAVQTRNVLSLRPEGNVGIGTATVSTILDIYKSSYTGPLLCLDTGTVSAGAGVMPQAIGKPLLRLGKLGYSQTTGDYYGIGFGYAPLITDFNCAEIGTLITSTAGNETGDLVFSTRPNGTNVAATERMRITSTGNVGIGTATVNNILQVGGGGRLRIANDNSDYTMIGTRDTNAATNTQITMYGNTHPNTSSPNPTYAGRMEFMTSADGPFVFFSGGTTERLRITSTGNVGIGTNTPNELFHLHKNANSADVRMILTDNTSTASATRGFHIIKATSNDAYIYNYENTAMVFGTNSAERLRITSTGNVGIGNNAPIAPLCIGNSAVTGSDGFIVIGKNSGGGSTRLFRIGYNDSYYMCFGDTGGSTLGTWVQQVQIQASTTNSGSLIIEGNGNVSNYLNSTTWQQRSDHRIKENIKKANVSICYDNVKNINLYRFNYIKGFKQGTQHDKTQLGFIAQQVEKHFPKSVNRNKSMLEDNREVPDLASIDVSQVNFTLFGAVKQLIRVVEKQSKRIKKLEEMLNIVEDDTIEDDADEPYVKIVCEGEVDIDTIVPSEPEETPENTSSSNSSNVF